MSDSDPYVGPRREWNDRYLELVQERRLWPVVAAAELVVLRVAVTGLVC